MKITKIVLTFISFLFISQISFAAVNACPGQSRDLTYSSTNVVSGTCITNADDPFIAPPAPAINSSGVWPISVSNNTLPGSYSFGLTCGGTPATGDTLNVLDQNSQTCCGLATGPSAGKVWNGTTCVVPACGNGLAASYQPTCTCPSGQSIVGSACQLTCTAPQVLNAAQTACVLPTPTCVLPQVLNAAGDTCILPTPNGTISANPNPCRIAYNASNCASDITWSSQYTSSPNVWLDSTTTFSNIPNGTQPFPFVAHGGNLFQLRDGTTVLNSATVSGVCVASTEWVGGKCGCPVGKVWNGSSCQISTTPSGYISASPATCTILPEESTCRATTTITWSTANVTNAKVEKTNSNEVITTTLLNASTFRNMISGATKFTLWNTTPNPDTVLASTTVLASCEKKGARFAFSTLPKLYNRIAARQQFNRLT